MTETCRYCGSPLPAPDRVSIFGMFDRHLFWQYTGGTVDEVISNWLAHIANPIPAIVGDEQVDDMGPTALCPATVLYGKKELRRVGNMVHVRSGRKPNPADVEAYRAALLADPDIPRLLAAPEVSDEG